MRPLRASLPDEQQPIRPHAHAANMGVCRFRRTLPIRLRAAYTQRTSLANRNLVTAIGPGRSSVVTNPDRDPWRVRRSPSYGFQARRTHTRSREIHRASPPTSRPDDLDAAPPGYRASQPLPFPSLAAAAGNRRRNEIRSSSRMRYIRPRSLLALPGCGNKTAAPGTSPHPPTPRPKRSRTDEGRGASLTVLAAHGLEARVPDLRDDTGLAA